MTRSRWSSASLFLWIAASIGAGAASPGPWEQFTNNSGAVVMYTPGEQSRNIHILIYNVDPVAGSMSAWFEQRIRFLSPEGPITPIDPDGLIRFASRTQLFGVVTLDVSAVAYETAAGFQMIAILVPQGMAADHEQRIWSSNYVNQAVVGRRAFVEGDWFVPKGRTAAHTTDGCRLQNDYATIWTLDVKCTRSHGCYVEPDIKNESIQQEVCPGSN